MGAIVPVVGAVVGLASTAKSISNQNKQAQSQRAAIDAQQQASAQNTALRLNEIERQKLFARSQTQIDNLARLNAREVERAETALSRQELALQEQTANAELAIQQQMSQQRLGSQNAQLDLQQFGANQQAQLNRNSAQNAFATTQARQTDNTRLQLQSSVLNQNQSLLDIERQRGNSVIGANQQQIAAQEQATQVLQGVASQARQFDRGVDDALRQQASMAIQLAAATGSANSLSDKALLANNLNDLSQDAQDFRVDANQQIGNVESSLNMQTSMRDYLLRQANQDAATRGAVTLGQGALQREGLFNSFSINQFANQAQLESTLAGINLSSQLGNQGNQLQRSQLSNQEQQTMALAQLDNTTTAGNIQQGRQGLDVLQSAQENKFKLGNEMATVNDRFADMDLNSQRVSAEVAGSSEINSLKAQRNSVQSPGFLGTVGQVASAGAGIYNGFLSNRG